MQYAPKQFVITPQKIHKHVTTPISQTPNIVFKILNRITQSRNSFYTPHTIFNSPKYH